MHEYSVQKRYRSYWSLLADTQKNGYTLLIILTIIDITLALNYQPIGIPSLYNIWKKDEIQNLKEVDPGQLHELIANFERKILSSMPDKKTAGAGAGKNGISDYANGPEDENIDYINFFENGVKDHKIKVLRKVIKTLDLEYLLDPDMLLGRAEKIQAYVTNVGSQKPKVIYSPFVWIYYCVRLIITGDDDNSTYKKPDGFNLFQQLIMLKVTFAYVNLIMEQGNGIVTSLEHLKYFFLYNTNESEALYAYNMKQEDPRKRFIHDINKKSQPKDWTLFDKTNKTTYNGYDLVYGKSIHENYVSIKGNTITEYVNKGFINRVKMLETLKRFGGQCTYSSDINVNTCPIVKVNEAGKPKMLNVSGIFESYEGKSLVDLENYPYITNLKKHAKDTSDKKLWRVFPVLNINAAAEAAAEAASASQAAKQTNKYIMMAHIMRGAMERSGYIQESDRTKYCDATRATLEFAESIKSDVGLCEKLPVSSWTGSAAKEENCDIIETIDAEADLINVLTKCSLGSCSEGSMGGGGRIIEVSPEMTCNYKFLGNYKPKLIKGTIGKLLGTINNTNFYNRLNKMSSLLNGKSRIRSKINKPSIRVARFRTKNRKG